MDDKIVRGFCEVVGMPPDPTTDIRSYPEARLGGCSDLNPMGNGLQADIVRIIPEEIAKMNVGRGVEYNANTSPMCRLLTLVSGFLLVSPNFDTLLGDITRERRRRKFDGMGMVGGALTQQPYIPAVERPPGCHSGPS